MTIVAMIFSLIFLPFFSGDCEKQRLEHLTVTSPYVVIGTVEEIEESTGITSGHFSLVVQRVNYKVKEVIKGDISEKNINVAHYVVAGSRTVEKDSTGFHLSEKVFSKGKDLLLFISPDTDEGYIGNEAKQEYKKFIAFDENCVPNASSNIIQLVKALLKNKK